MKTMKMQIKHTLSFPNFNSGAACPKKKKKGAGLHFLLTILFLMLLS